MTPEGGWTVTIIVLASVCGIVLELVRAYDRYLLRREAQKDWHAHEVTSLERAWNALRRMA